MPQSRLPAMDVVELGAEVRDRALQGGRGRIAVALVLELAIPEELHHEAQLGRRVPPVVLRRLRVGVVAPCGQ